LTRLATLPGTVQERLNAAWLHLILAQPKDMPNDALRRVLIGIRDDLSFQSPTVEVGGVAETLKIMSDEDARNIARRILDLHRDLEEIRNRNLGPMK
jgi:hypothetical protein